jgi:hypothetical protein
MRTGIHASTRSCAAAIVILTCSVTTRPGWAAPAAVEAPDEPVATAPRPCRLVVPQPLREIVDDA